jgi:hypothetical protein
MYFSSFLHSPHAWNEHSPQFQKKKKEKEKANLAPAHDANQDARDSIRSPAMIRQSKAVEVKPCSETRV